MTTSASLLAVVVVVAVLLATTTATATAATATANAALSTSHDDFYFAPFGDDDDDVAAPSLGAQFDEHDDDDDDDADDELVGHVDSDSIAFDQLPYDSLHRAVERKRMFGAVAGMASGVMGGMGGMMGGGKKKDKMKFMNDPMPGAVPDPEERGLAGPTGHNPPIGAYAGQYNDEYFEWNRLYAGGIAERPEKRPASMSRQEARIVG